MNKALAQQESEVPARPLKVLVPLIQEELQAGDEAGMEHYRRAGELLLEAKAQLHHGEWQGWVERNFHLSYRTAKRYMQAAELFAQSEKGRRRQFPEAQTLSELIEPHREHHQPAWATPIQQITQRVDAERLAQERQNKQTEQRLVRELAARIVEIGFKVLATKLHPDKRGGSREAMQRLTAARDLLKRCL